MHGEDGAESDRGHSDFPGSVDKGGIFDYNKEDVDPKTAPTNPKSTWKHFRSLDDSEKDLANDVKECRAKKFERHMHQMQDFFSHYGQGFRAAGGPGGWGHGATSAGAGVNRAAGGSAARPDNASDYRDAFKAASDRSQLWLDRWNKCCCCDENKKCTIKGGRPEAECSGPPPENPWDEKAPPPTPQPGAIDKAGQAVEQAGENLIDQLMNMANGGFGGQW